MNILYLMDSYNIYGGTPKKTLDLMRYFGNKSYLYIYDDKYTELKYLFGETDGKIYEGFYGKNIFRHIKKLLNIIDENNITIVQTQFSMGEVLGYLIKLFRPQVKLIVAFVGPFVPGILKRNIVNKIYKKVDCFIYISEYVRNEKNNQFPILKQKKYKIIYNGTKQREQTSDNFPHLKTLSLLSVSGLTEWKNINVLIEAMNKIVHNYNKKDIFLYIAGEGEERAKLEEKISKYILKKNIFLLGYQKNIGALLNTCDIYVHPAYAEGFGIAIAEAMMSEKPIIVANAGALPELIVNDSSGLIVDPFDSDAWAEAIITIIKDKEKALFLGKAAKEKAIKDFSIEKYRENYKKLYEELLSE